MSNAPKVLVDTASKYASEAIKFDSQGSRGTAIQKYQQAVDTLLRLAKLHPNYALNKIYLKNAKIYQDRITALQNTTSTSNNIIKSNPSNGGQQASIIEPLNASYGDVILQEKPNVKWNEVVGLDDAKKALQESITFPSIRPELFPLGWPRGILLYGPPGCGKTILAAAVASEIDGYFMNVDATTIMAKWLGDAEKNVSKLFGNARHMINNGKFPVIIFIDEVDSLFGKRDQEIGGAGQGPARRRAHAGTARRLPDDAGPRRSSQPGLRFRGAGRERLCICSGRAARDAAGRLSRDLAGRAGKGAGAGVHVHRLRLAHWRAEPPPVVCLPVFHEQGALADLPSPEWR